MLKNRIGSRKIEERLGRSGPSWDERGDPRSDEPSSNGNTLFACIVVALFMTGAAIGLAASNRASGFRQALLESIKGPPPVPPYRSRVADACDQGWKNDRFNRDQIHCHMTRDVARLCDRRERRALVDKLVAYQSAADRLGGRMTAVAFRMIANPGNTLAMGVAEARSRDPNLSENERAEQFNKTLEMSHEIMSPMDAIRRDNINTATKEDLIADVKSLVEQGYLASADFSSSTQPNIVREGIAVARSVRVPYCPDGDRALP